MTDAEAPVFWSFDVNSQLTGMGKIEGRRRRGHQRIRWLDGIIDAMNINLGKLGDSEGQGGLVCTVHGVTKRRT